MLLKLNKFDHLKPKKKTIKKERSNNVKHRNKYCNSSIVPELGHKHKIKCNKLNKHLREKIFVIIGFNSDGTFKLNREDGKSIMYKRISKGKTEIDYMYSIDLALFDLVYNPDNEYKEIIVSNRRIKKNRKGKQIKKLENECIVKLLDSDPLIEDHAFIIRNLKDCGDHYTATLINGLKWFTDINPFDYLDIISGGYKWTVVASRNEVLSNSNPLYGYCKDALDFKEINDMYKQGRLCQNDGIAKVIIDSKLYTVIDSQQEIFKVDGIPLNEPVEGTIIDDVNKIIKLNGLDV